MYALLLLLMSCSPPAEPEGFTHTPLVGAHGEASCSECHGESLDGDTPVACSGCHEGDEPADHYAGECGDCHQMDDWATAVVDHDPLFPTPHRGVSECSACHTTGDNSQFSCIDCHEHRRSEMDDEHLGEVGGYRWESPACLDCHPRGREEDDD